MKPFLIALLTALFASQAQAQSLQKGHTTELLHESAEAPIGVIVGTQLNNVIHDIGLTVDQPGRLSQTWPTADAVLHIRAPQTTAGDTSARSVAATNNLVPLSTTDTTINFLTGGTTGATVYTNGGTFTLPTSTIGNYVRMVAVLQKDGTINTNFSTQQTTVAALTNPGTLLGSLSGDPLGWLDLQAVTTTTYKSAGAGTSVIQNSVSGTPTVTSFGSGGGGGSGAGSSFILWHPVDGNAPIYAEEFSEFTYQFPAGGGQQLRGTLQIPGTYIAGNPVKLYLSQYSPSVTGTSLLTCTSYLIQKSAATAVSSTTNSRTSTNTAINLATLAVANGYYQVTCDVTDTTGHINSVAVSPGDILAVYVTRGTDTDTADLRFLPSAVGISLQ
jgi:hypothetical protein